VFNTVYKNTLTGVRFRILDYTYDKEWLVVLESEVPGEDPVTIPSKDLERYTYRGELLWKRLH